MEVSTSLSQFSIVARDHAGRAVFAIQLFRRDIPRGVNGYLSRDSPDDAMAPRTYSARVYRFEP